MSAPFHFELVAPESLIFSGDVTEVIVPGAEGQFTVLAGHAPLIATLRPGILHIHSAGKHQEYFLQGGFAEVTPAGLAVLAEHAQPVEEIDLAAFDSLINDLHDDISDAKTDAARIKAEEKLVHLLDMKQVLATRAA